MKKLFLCTICMFTLLGTVDVSADQCATFDFASNILHVPCINFVRDGQVRSSWQDMTLVSLNPLVFGLADSGFYETLIDDARCARIDNYRRVVRIPCFRLGEKEYWLSLLIVSSDPVYLLLSEFHENTCNDSGAIFNTALLTRDKFGIEKRTFKEGELIVVQVAYRNLTCTERLMPLQGSSLEIHLTNEMGIDLNWHWIDESFLGPPSFLKFEPNEAKVYTFVWNQTDDQEKTVPPGKYKVQGYLPDGYPGLRAHSETISEVIEIEIEQMPTD